jgi:hypothetical protein
LKPSLGELFVKIFKRALLAIHTSAVIEASNAIGVISSNQRDFIGLGYMRVFYGWRIVAACMLCALVGNALGLFGAGVYLHEVVTANTFSAFAGRTGQTGRQ